MSEHDKNVTLEEIEASHSRTELVLWKQQMEMAVNRMNRVIRLVNSGEMDNPDERLPRVENARSHVVWLIMKTNQRITKLKSAQKGERRFSEYFMDVARESLDPHAFDVLMSRTRERIQD